jgi:hypothetical protein
VPQANTWSLVELALSDLGGPASMSDLVIQDSSGSTQPTFYLDALTFAAPAGAAPKPSPNPTQAATIAPPTATAAPTAAAPPTAVPTRAVPPTATVLPPTSVPPTATAAAPQPQPSVPPVVGQPGVFRETFEGEPASPQRWNPANWDVTIHTRGPTSSFDPMEAHHGADCGAPPTTHTIQHYEQAVFLCRNHLMTALNASDYGAIYLTPNHLVDFSQGEAVIRFDMSTLRSSGRDWVDLWITPFDDSLQLPLDDWLPDLQGDPRRAVHVRMDNTGPQSMFRLNIVRNFVSQEVQGGKTFVGYESFLEASPSRRDTFEVRISRTHIRVGMPQYNFWWHDVNIADLGWSRGVVQFGHHSYTPTKDCTSCKPNTWHWDNVEISPAQPFTMLKADRRVVDASASGPVRFSGPAPEGARLRFAGIGGSLEVSVDGGATWRAAQLQIQERYDAGHFRSYWTPVPAGTTEVLIRGQNKDSWNTGPWMVRDISIWAQKSSG